MFSFVSKTFLKSSISKTFLKSMQLLFCQRKFEDISHVHQLVMMQWRTNAQRALQWIPRGEAHLPLDSARWVSEIAALRDASPSIYMHAVWRDNSLVPNCQIK